MAPLETTAQPAARSQDGSARRWAAHSGVAWLLVLLGLFVFFWRQAPGVLDAFRFALPDSDDMMRLLGVRDLLAGQSWFDLTQYRYLPPAGVPMHWSRLVDVPLVAGLAGLSPFIGPQWAERLTVALWPFLLFATYAGLVGWGAWRLFGALAAGLAVFTASQMIVFSDLFAAGRIDHHNIQVILVAAAAIGFGLSGERGRAGLASGAMAGASLAIGLETLPFVACVALAYAIAWIVKGEPSVRPFLAFAGGLVGAATAGFLAQTAPSQLLIPQCDAFSSPWLMLIAGSGLAAFGVVAAAPWLPSWRSRLAAAALATAALALAVGVSFPACWEGPYQIVPPPVRSIWLHNIVEAFSFRRFLQANPNAALQSVMPLLIGAVAASLAAYRERSEQRGMLALLASLLWLGVALAQFQIRTVYIASAFLPLAAGWFLGELLSPRREHLAVFTRVASVCCGMLMFGIPWAVGVTAVEAVTSDSASAASPRVACSDPDSVAALNALPPGLVLAQIDLGPAILLHTPHGIMAAGYHRGPAGIIAAIEAFSGAEDDMRRVAERNHVDYVVTCPNWLSRGREQPRAFAKVLVDGGSAAWLDPLSLGDSPLQAWRVAQER